MTATYQIHDTVAVMTLNNPPVNGLNLSIRAAVVANLERARGDAAITTVVIIGAGNMFSAGADIKEFDTAAGLIEPTLHTIISTVENFDKPIVAAIHGVCMGGGLELALGCHYRVAAWDARIALPEIKLGLLPGAGGTQRLPRMIGVELALRMILSGAPVLSQELNESGLFDKLIEGDLLTAAVHFAKSVAAIRPLPKVRDRQIPAALDFNEPAFFQHQRDEVAGKTILNCAALKCIDAVAASVSKNFDDGIACERALFFDLLQTSESKALRAAFFVNRAASK